MNRKRSLERGEAARRRCDPARPRHGLTLVEVMTASVIGVLVAAGTAQAFLFATKVARQSVATVEAAGYAAQTLERFRNRIACDDVWFNGSTACNFGGLMDPDLPTTLRSDPLPSGSSGSAFLNPNFTPVRQYRVQPADCDGNTGTTGECYRVEVTVSWGSPS